MKKTIKKSVSFLLAAVMMLSVLAVAPFTVSAATYGDYEYGILDNGTAEITKYTGADTNLKIPLKIKGYSITSIGAYAFGDCDKLESVEIPNNVTNLSMYSFTSCDNLKNIKISNSVANIDLSAFNSCTNLDNVIIPDSVTYIKPFTFRNCTNLKNIKISNSVTYIDQHAFDYCTSLTSINLPNSLESLGECAFLGCSSLKEIKIPSSLSFIPWYAFIDCTNLKSITIPSNVTSIGEYAFGYKYDELYNIIKIPNVEIRGFKNTAAEKYAKDNGFKFVALVAPTSVKLNATALKLSVGESGTLKTTLAPANGYSASYEWSTSNSSVVTVSNGKVTAKKAGTATITVKTDNGKTASCKVTVYNAPNSVKLSLTSAKLGVGESYTLKATLPANTYSRLSWSSSNTKIATVSNGKLVAKAKGTTTIAVKTSNGKTATCKLTVYPAPTSVKLNATSVTIGLGEKFTISETVNKGAYACTPNLKWSTANAKIAAIAKGKSNTAVITGKKAGTTTVKITLYNGKTATCKMTVKAAPKSVKLNKTAITLKKGQKYTLTYSVNSGACANPVNTKWSSNNTKGVTVAKGAGNKCVVTAKNKGTATITVKTYNGKTAKCKVIVK